MHHLSFTYEKTYFQVCQICIWISLKFWFIGMQADKDIMVNLPFIDCTILTTRQFHTLPLTDNPLFIIKKKQPLTCMHLHFCWLNQIINIVILKKKINRFLSCISNIGFFYASDLKGACWPFRSQLFLTFLLLNTTLS